MNGLETLQDASAQLKLAQIFETLQGGLLTARVLDEMLIAHAINDLFLFIIIKINENKKRQMNVSMYK